MRGYSAHNAEQITILLSVIGIIRRQELEGMLRSFKLM